MMKQIERLITCLAFAGLFVTDTPAQSANGRVNTRNSTRAPDSTSRGSTNGLQISLLNEFRPIGGINNNLTHPELDAVPGAAELALTPLNFNGTNHEPVGGPNPRTISNIIAGGTGANGQNETTEDTNSSAWLYVFGQFVDHDLSLEDNPSASPPIDITIPPGDPVFGAGSTIAMTRDLRDPATDTIINTVAGYLDLSQLYGSVAEVAASLRNPDGTLASSDNGRALPIINGQFVTGDPRVMENPELTAVTTLFMREHNYWVGQLTAQHPDWTGDQLYNMAKAITTAEYQNIVYKEYLPLLIGDVLGSYQGYNPNINAQVTQEFSTAAFRVGHSQVSDQQAGIDNSGNVVFEQSLGEAFFNTPEQTLANGIDPLLRNVSADPSQATDVYSVSTLRNLLFAPLADGNVDQIDLIAIDIQREKDVGLGTLNQTRLALGLAPYESFASLTRDPVLQTNLQNVYTNIDNVDLFMGGLAENHARGSLVGPTFQRIIGMQFQALRSGDRFFWLNQPFDTSTASRISQTTLGQVIVRNTDTTSQRDNVFVLNAPPTRSRQHEPSTGFDFRDRSRPAFIDGGH